MYKSLSCIVIAYYTLFFSLTTFEASAQKTKAPSESIDVPTKDGRIWRANQKQIQNLLPHLGWKKTQPNEYTCSQDSMTYWQQNICKLVLTINPENQKAQSLTYTILTPAKTKDMPSEERLAEVVKWQALLNTAYKTKGKKLPQKESKNVKLTHTAWVLEDYITVLAVQTKKQTTSIELTYHEPNHGLATLGIKEDIEERTTESKTEPDTNAETSPKESTISNKDISRGSTRKLQKQFNIEENFDAEWPKLIKEESPDIEVIKEDEENKIFIYQSPNYEFICDVQISKNIIKNFSTLFEATRSYCQQLPLSMVKAHMPEDTVKFKILLFGSKDSYFKNGGPPGSAGVYMSGSGVIMVPLSSLGVKKVGSRFMFDYKVSNKTLPHEITHQLTNTEYFSAGSRGWFSEGLAEYVGATAYRSGKFMVGGNLSDIRSYVTEGSRKDGRGRYLGDKLNAPDLKEFMTMSYRSFTGNANFNYGLGALITYYFLHMENDGDRKNINQFLTALNDGKQGDEALNALLNGRTFDELEEEISKAWKSRGVKITFR